MHKSPVEILSEFDAQEGGRRRRVVWLTLVPLVVIVGVYGFMLVQLARSSKQLDQQIRQLNDKSRELIITNERLLSQKAALADVQQQRQQLEDSIATLQNAVDSLQDNQKAITLALEQNKLPSARCEDVRKLVMNPDIAKRTRAISLWNQGYSAFNRGEREQAKSFYEQANHADPTYAPAVNSLGRLAYDAGDLKSADVLLEKASKLDRTYVPTIHNRALIASKQGRLSEAIQLNEQSLRLKPNYEPAVMLQRDLKASHR